MTSHLKIFQSITNRRQESRARWRVTCNYTLLSIYMRSKDKLERGRISLARRDHFSAITASSLLWSFSLCRYFCSVLYAYWACSWSLYSAVTLSVQDIIFCIVTIFSFVPGDIPCVQNHISVRASPMWKYPDLNHTGTNPSV